MNATRELLPWKKVNENGVKLEKYNPGKGVYFQKNLQSMYNHWPLKDAYNAF